MNQPRLLLLSALILLSASVLLGQPTPSLGQGKQYGDPVVCNDGAIPFSVVRASRNARDFLTGNDQWVVEGWYNADPGKCTEIGADGPYVGGGLLGEDSATLIAFAFSDSKGVWRGIKVQGGDSGWFYPMYPASQQICVSRGQFAYKRNSPKQADLARECDRPQDGYLLIPASFIYKGSNKTRGLFDGPPDPHDYLHVKIGSDDRAITSGSSGVSQSGGATQGGGDASLCGKISCVDLFLQKLNEAAVQQSAASANNNPPPPRPSAAPPPSAPAPRAAPKPVENDNPFGTGGFITPPTTPAPALVRADSLRWVRADLPTYLDASRNGFEAYKKGNVLLSQGLRMWDSNTKPSAARGCWVVQAATNTTLSCALSERGDVNGLRPYYTALNQEIAATLPRDWATLAQPPFGDAVPNQGFRSSSGAHLEVWMQQAESGVGYEIHFELITAH